MFAAAADSARREWTQPYAALTVPLSRRRLPPTNSRRPMRCGWDLGTSRPRRQPSTGENRSLGTPPANAAAASFAPSRFDDFGVRAMLHTTERSIDGFAAQGSERSARPKPARREVAAHMFVGSHQREFSPV